MEIIVKLGFTKCEEKSNSSLVNAKIRCCIFFKSYASWQTCMKFSKNLKRAKADSSFPRISMETVSGATACLKSSSTDLIPIDFIPVLTLVVLRFTDIPRFRGFWNFILWWSTFKITTKEIMLHIFKKTIDKRQLWGRKMLLNITNHFCAL